MAAAAYPALQVFDWPVPEGGPRTGSVLLVHGFGEHLGRYADVAPSLNDLGLHVRGYDARGHGRSPGPRGVIRDPPALLGDLVRMFGLLSLDAAEAGDAHSPFVLGHSLGAALAARAASSSMIAPRGLILSAPPFSLGLPLYRQAGVAVGLRLFPDRAVPNGQAQDAISHDRDAVARYLEDPLVHDRITMRLANFAQETGGQAIREAPHLRIPTLLLVAGADRHVDPAGSQAFFDALPPGVGTLRWYDQLYHELLHEREPDRTRVLADMRSWLQGQLDQRNMTPSTSFA
jgi:alpha-beta hydrolase superfamily lysophospholipase